MPRGDFSYRRQRRRVPLSSGGGIAEVYQERRAGRSRDAQRSQRTYTRPGVTPTTPITYSAPSSSGGGGRSRSTGGTRASTSSSRRGSTYSRVMVPSIVPPQYRQAVAIQGQLLNDALRNAGINMTGPEYLARLIQFESSWNPAAEGPPIPQLGGVTAKGLGQFIPSTAQDFINRLGVNPYGRPGEQIKAAAMHASGKFGYQPLYAGYNPGYSENDPILEVPGGDLVPVRVPRRALRRASQGKPTGTLTGGKLPGAYAGSRRIVRELVGRRNFRAYGRDDKRTPESNASVGGSSTSIHLTTNKTGYAADLPPRENIVDRIARKLGMDPRQVNYGSHPPETTYKGYRIEFLPFTHGTGPHIHIGAQWTGKQLPPGTIAGGLGGGAGGFSAAPSTGSSSGSATPNALLGGRAGRPAPASGGSSRGAPLPFAAAATLPGSEFAGGLLQSSSPGDLLQQLAEAAGNPDRTRRRRLSTRRRRLFG